MTRLTAERPGTAAAADRTAANVLQLDRVTEGPGGTVTVSSSNAATASGGGGLFVHACSTCDGAFASLQVGEPITALRFGCYGREEAALIAVGTSGSLTIKMLQRQADLDQAPCSRRARAHTRRTHAHTTHTPRAHACGH